MPPTDTRIESRTHVRDDPYVDFSREEAAYERERARLVIEHLGCIALIHGDDVVGVFSTIDQAIWQGYQRFGNDQTMLKEFRDREQARFHSPRRKSPPLVPSGLNLNLRGRSHAETGLGSGMSNLFAVPFEFPDTSLGAIPELLVARLALPSALSVFHGVIGRDVLRRWEYFRYKGRRQRLIIRDKPHLPLRWLTG